MWAAAPDASEQHSLSRFVFCCHAGAPLRLESHREVQYGALQEVYQQLHHVPGRHGQTV